MDLPTRIKRPVYFYSFSAVVSIVVLLCIQYQQPAASEFSSRLTSLLRRRSVEVRQSDSFVLSGNLTLNRRDDGSCSASKPCANGACCGQSGYCGYGPSYCGSGCLSNCNAVAECGQYASPAGKTCPLNTCCSQYGFCGTTSDFCTTNCQSNCVLHPTPSGSGGKVLDKVIGYYESWSSRLACHRVAPNDLPLDALTHVNYAFAYIDPSSFNLVTMDAQTPALLFQSVADLKKYKSSLKVFLSVGGWTFSDNGTATQPVFGNIAASAANRQTFANNVLAFMNQYGLDGIDIDWEYPGAPDRGGKTADTANFVSLLQTLRATFNSSPRSLGITFTAPSSYWYLRWFDLPGLLQYADWLNFMTYDLHGVWDRNNPIGSIVQSHTNLTEIQLATELLWRVKVPPSKVSMGFGFYGRSFQLANPSCSTPGCLFSGGAAPGPCSATSGILTYYEIMALLAQNPGLTPTWDKVAAAKYVKFNGDQWVSYDDADTFKQKVDWANGIGLGGSLIWASDLGLLGRTINHVNVQPQALVTNPDSIGWNILGQTAQGCIRLVGCTDTNNPQARACPGGMNYVGFDEGVDKKSCGGVYGHSICCPSSATPKECIWRGGGLDCNGQCHPGEYAALNNGSSWGGYPTEGNLQRCNRGEKLFCCQAPDYQTATDQCYWTGCKGSCKSGEDALIKKYSDGCSTGAAGAGGAQLTYCCPSPSRFTNCLWRGSSPDCADAKCLPSEVSIGLGPGDTFGGCSWGRQKTACCQLKAPPPAPISCSYANVCDYDPGFCQIALDDAYGSSGYKRDLGHGQNLNVLGKRGGKRPFKPDISGINQINFRPYPSRGELFNTQQALGVVLRRWWTMRQGSCTDATADSATVDPTNLPPDTDTEHPIDLQVIIPYVEQAITGILPSRGTASTPRIAASFFNNVFTSLTGLPPGLAPVTPNSPDLRNPSDRVMEAFGSYTNRNDFVLAQHQINAVKGAIFGLEVPINANNYYSLVQLAAANNDRTSMVTFLNYLRVVQGVFNYVQDPLVTTRFNNVAALIRTQLAVIEANTAGGTGLAAHWDEFWPDYRRQIVIFAQNWVQERVDQARQVFGASTGDGALLDQVLAALTIIENNIGNMNLPGI